MLALRARSASDLARSLQRKGEEKPHVDWAIARLKEQGLLDDAAFARRLPAPRSWTESSRGDASSRTWLERECRATVPDEAIDTVFEEEAVDQRAIVEEAARKKLRSLAGLDPIVQRRRLYASSPAEGTTGRHPRALPRSVRRSARRIDSDGVEDAERGDD